MLWILLSVGIALLSLVVLALVLLTLWRKLKVLTRELTKAAESVEVATGAVRDVQTAGARAGADNRTDVGLRA